MSGHGLDPSLGRPLGEMLLDQAGHYPIWPAAHGYLLDPNRKPLLSPPGPVLTPRSAFVAHYEGKKHIPAWDLPGVQPTPRVG